MIGAISAAFGYRSIIHQHLNFHRHHHPRALVFSAVANMSPPHSGETILAMSAVEDIETAHDEKSSAEIKTVARLVSTTQS